jgi:hypothetical protein
VSAANERQDNRSRDGYLYRKINSIAPLFSLLRAGKQCVTNRPLPDNWAM